MSDFELEAWEWPPGLERRYLVEPFQSDCLAWFGFTRVTLCVIPFRGAQGEAGASADDAEFMVVFRPESWREEARLSWAKSASMVGEPLGVPMLNYTLSTGLRLFPLNRTLFELPLDAPHIEEFLRTELPTLLFLPHHLESVPYFYLEEGLCFLRDEEGWWNNADISTPFRLPVRCWVIVRRRFIGGCKARWRSPTRKCALPTSGTAKASSK